MQPSPALRRWLDDPALQAATRARVAAAGVRGDDALARFAATLATLDARDRATIGIAVIRAIHDLFAEAGWFEALLARMVAELRADPFFEPPLRSMGTGTAGGLMLADHPLAAVCARVLPAGAVAAKRAAGPRSIGFTGVPTLIRVVRGGGARIACYETDLPGDSFTAADAPPCRFAGRRVLADGDLLAVDGRTQSFVVEAGPADLLLLLAEARAAAIPVAREYDAATLRLVGSSGTDEGASRAQLMLSLLRLLGRRDAAPSFARLAADGPFFLRWYAMRELVALDPAAAAAPLQAMAAADPHPEVRAAATLTAAMLARPAAALPEAA